MTSFVNRQNKYTKYSMLKSTKSRYIFNFSALSIMIQIKYHETTITKAQVTQVCVLLPLPTYIERKSLKGWLFIK